MRYHDVRGAAGTARTPTISGARPPRFDVLLQVKAQAYLYRGRERPAHEHEWAVWRDVRLPEGKILVPGVVTHSTDVVDPPALVGRGIGRLAPVVAAEKGIAGPDGGFGGGTHPRMGGGRRRWWTEGAPAAWGGLGRRP